MTTLLHGGTVLDGTGAAGYPADVVIADNGTIAEIVETGNAAATGTDLVLDATGAVVAPGFIDLHSHADYSVFGAPEALTQTHQGVTTLVTGNCGFSPFPLSDEHAAAGRGHTVFDTDLSWNWRGADQFLDAVDALPLAVNIAAQVGHGALRIAAMGADRRAPTESEQGRMRGLLRDCIEAGVVGLSSGLIYPPGSFGTAAELADLCSVVAEHGLLYSSHIRNESDQLLTAVTEAIDTARESGARLEISHLKAIGPTNWGGTAAALAMIARARADGVDVGTDVYPYTASSTTLTSRMPDWAMDGGRESLLLRLSDPVTAAAIADGLRAQVGPSLLPDRIVVAHTIDGPYREHVGRSIADIAARLGLDPAQTVVELLRGQHAVVSIINHGMSDDDLDRVIAHPLAAIASDGAELATSGTQQPHPRSFGTFVRVLGHYARDRGLIDLPAAVHKMTALPASRLGWTDRGVIRRGAVADLCVFDPQTVIDRSTYDAPWQLADGVRHTLIAGRPVLQDGLPTDARPGRVIRGRAGVVSDRR
ncbi:N-acyl-D-amino-acid deacylase family protein [Nakamurella lactea]|uniref:N-acyl-D-amino-acid deacylase family protein n=1 Tax=Nakamurella lactea TaxID=459515 RepID=UPI0004239720|nr:D-aminoacylase [Nakamurella lactea]